MYSMVSSGPGLDHWQRSVRVQQTICCHTGETSGMVWNSLICGGWVGGSGCVGGWIWMCGWVGLDVWVGGSTCVSVWA